MPLFSFSVKLMNRVFQDMACFGMGLKLTHAEKELLAPIINVGHHSTFLINDYWSWPKEVSKYFENSEPNLPPNAVCVFMQEFNCSEAEGQQRVRDEIVNQQRIHLDMIKEFEQKQGPLPEKFHQYFAAVQQTASGSEYWSCYSPRYPRKEDLKQPEILIVDGKLKYKTGEWEFVPWKPGKVELNGVTPKPLKAANGTQPVQEQAQEQVKPVTQNGEKRSGDAEPVANGISSRACKRQCDEGGFVTAPAEVRIPKVLDVNAANEGIDRSCSVQVHCIDAVQEHTGKVHRCPGSVAAGAPGGIGFDQEACWTLAPFVTDVRI